ncbi:hypothetical protein H5T89_05960 [bacterium]|nr:hypothetical protein [bacterium]
MKNKILISTALVLVSLSQLYLEVLLTRMFSITQGYHWAFLIVGLALLGNGMGGTYLIFRKDVHKDDGIKHLRLISMLYPLSIILAYIGINLLPFDPYLVPWSKVQLLYFFFNLSIFLIPFFFSGLIVSLSLTLFSSIHSTLYCMTFIGASVGSLFALLSLSMLSEFRALLVSIIVGFLASLLLCRGSRYNSISAVLLLVFMHLFVYMPFDISLRFSPYKDLSQMLKIPSTRILATYRNVSSRIDIIESPTIRYAPGLSYKYIGKVPSGIGITIDGENLKGIITSNHFTDYLPQAVLYELKKDPKILIVNPIGGLDIVLAMEKNTKDITVVFENPIMVDVIKKYLPYSSNIHYIAEHPRVYFAQDKELFDVIQFSLEESFYVVTSGSYSLKENYTYTVEGFKSAYSRLNPGGVILFTRWLQRPPVEELRLFNIILTGLRELGIKEPERRVISFRSLNTMTFLVKNGEFTREEIYRIKYFLESMAFDPVFFYGLKPAEVNRFNVLPDDIYYEYFQQILKDKNFSKRYPFCIDPPRDDRPFFFQFFKRAQIPTILRNWGRTWQPFGGAGYIIIIAVILLIILISILIIMLPFILKRAILPMSCRISSLSIYFFAIGLGYLFVEIPIIQRLILYLGKPVYSFSIILAIILVSSGFGSIFALRLNKYPIPLVLGASIITISLTLPFILEFSLKYPFYLRIFICIAIVSPLGFLMGIPFPIALERAKNYSVSTIPWYWAINGVASVLSSFLSTVIAMYTGFTFILIISGLLYLLSGFILLSSDKRNKEDVT